MSSPKQNKSGIINLLSSGSNNNAKFVPPVLREVGKLAAGVAAVQTTTGSATGNPRNKCALLPGHSLMDWIRLGNSGKDLTGVGKQAGLLTITPNELSKHNKLTDAWLSIRGKVYNVTSYLPFHPGGPDELMKGVGKDATSLFDQVHSWVNYESILQKCLIGRLTLSPSLNVENLFEISARKPENCENPKFDWIQKTNDITLIFYTPPLENPIVEIRKMEEIIRVIFIFKDCIFTNDFTFSKGIKWPPNGKINYESGKIELVFKKNLPEIWENYGVLKQNLKIQNNNKIECSISKIFKIYPDVLVCEIDQKDQRTMTPIGFHIRVFSNSTDEISRSYTPIPQCLIDKVYEVQKFTTDKIVLMIRKYENGFLSKEIFEKTQGDIMYISKPLNNGFVLKSIEKKDKFLLLAAGTGITPMFSIILFLLERRIKKCQSIRLIYCNRKSSVPFKEQLEQLSKNDSRFQLEFLISEPEDDYNGKTGRITFDIIKETIEKQLEISNTPNFFSFICGPIGFNDICLEFLKKLDLKNDQIHVFQG